MNEMTMTASTSNNEIQKNYSYYSPEMGDWGKKNSENPSAVENLGPYQKLPVVVCPQICIWYFMNKADLSAFLKISDKKKIRGSIEHKVNLNNQESAIAKTVLVELLYNVTKFCKCSDFSLEQAGVVISIFFLTHKFFISNLCTSAEKTYNYFKELLLRHSVSAPPDNIKVFCYQDSKKVLNFFCTIYLRNLPLVRLLVLPNYGFYLEHKLEPEFDFSVKKAVVGKDKKGKNKKGKDKKDKKGKKKAKK